MYIEKDHTLQIIHEKETEEKRELPAGTQAVLWRREAAENEQTEKRPHANKIRRVEVIRAEELWQQAGACYVRIQAAAGRPDFSIQDLFDEQDTSKTKYILILADDFPVASGRMYKLDKEHARMDRFAVLPSCRGIGYGRLVLREAERWAIELGYKHMVVESSRNKAGFYERLGYAEDPEADEESETVLMEKDLTKSRKKKKKKA